MQHIGIGENVELAKMLEIVYRLMCSLDYVHDGLQLLLNLVTIKNWIHTGLFLSLSTLFIIHYEICIPLALFSASLKMLQILYKHEKFQVQPPNVKSNIEFIKVFSMAMADAKE